MTTDFIAIKINTMNTFIIINSTTQKWNNTSKKKKPQTAKLQQDEIDNLNIFTTIKEIEFVVKKP